MGHLHDGAHLRQRRARDFTSQTSPDTGTTTFGYDDAGNPVSRTDARSVTTTYSYDALNRVTAATVPDGAMAYEYDNLTTGGPYAKGQLTKITDPSGSTAFTYDARGRVTSKTESITGSAGTKTLAVGYGYTSGRRSSITYPSGRSVAYGFDAAGQVTSVSVSGVAILGMAEYAPFGLPRKWTWSNGQVMERTYDNDGRVKTITQGPATWAYADTLQLFDYDAADRLVNATLAAGQTQSFTYDANGNRTGATINAQSSTYTYPTTSHRLTSVAGAVNRSFTYDAMGNAITVGGITWAYDGRGRAKQAGAVTFAVNGLGQRVRKSGAAGEVFFGYDEAGHLIGEYDAAGATITETVWLGDVPVAVVKPSASGFDVFYVWADHLNTPRLVTDAADNDRWEWPHNDPFGNNAANENPQGLGIFSFNLRFPGQYFDAETGTHYNYFRDYDPVIGRYRESDPIGLGGGTNTFAYTTGNPLRVIDPLGLFSLSDLAVIVNDATGGCSSNGFVDDVVSNFANVQDHTSLLKAGTSLALGGAFAKQYGGLTAAGAAWGLFKETRSGFTVTGIGSRTFAQALGTAAGTWAINTVLIKGSFDAGVLAGSILRTSINRLAATGACTCKNTGT